MTSEWKGALRLQIEALARRNDLHRRCNRVSVQIRTKEMDVKIIKMRELLSTDANQAAQFYLECVCHADETERILNRTSSRDKKHQRKRENGLRYISSFNTGIGARSIASSSPVEVISADALQSIQTPYLPKKWWNVHRKEEYYDVRKHEIRELWNSQNDFLSHCLALVIGVGNLIRFPAAVYRAGGTFILPYLFLQIVVGFPLVFLQMSIGQFAAMGPAAALGRMASAASGLGWCLALMSIPFGLYFNIYASWFLYYLTETIFTPNLGWIHCGGNFNSSRICCPIDHLEICKGANHTVFSTETFMHSTVLHVAGSSLGSLQPPIVAGLAVAWLLTILIYFKPSPTLNFTATLPFFILILLALCGTSFPGASIGLSYLFSFKLRQLYTIDIWLLALEQVLFELALCGGPIITLAAMNRFRNNVYRDAGIIVFRERITGSHQDSPDGPEGNHHRWTSWLTHSAAAFIENVSVDVVTTYCRTFMGAAPRFDTILCSMLSAIVVFCFAGHLITFSGVEMRKLVAYDPRYFSLVVLPSMTYTIQGGTFWFGLIAASMVLGVVDAQYSWVRCLTVAILNKLKSKNQILDRRLFILISAVFFVCGLPFCTLGGVYLFHSIDCLIVTWTVSLALFLLTLLISYSYGVNNFLRDLSCMLRIPLHQRWAVLSCIDRFRYLLGPTGIFIKYSWSIFMPFILLVATVLFLASRDPIAFARNDVPWPYEVTAWIIIALPLLPIPVIFLLKIMKSRRNGKTFYSLFDGSKWLQLELDQEIEPEGTSPPPTTKRRRTAIRENTYMYIDPLSRGNTERSVTAIHIDDNYGWRVGRLKEVQEDPSLQPSESQNSFDMSTGSQSTAKGEIALFGSPPASNAFIMSEAISRAAAARRHRTFSASPSPTPRIQVVQEMFNKHSCASEPPVVPNTPPPRSSPGAKSEPPRAMTDRPSSSLRSKSTCSNSSDDEDGVKPQRVTVIRRFCSEDSVGLQSNTSISITPIDRLTQIDRQRSMSSLAIYDPQSESRPKQNLSQLKRPQPINAPNKSPTRF